MPNLRFKFWMDSNFTYIFVFFQVPFLAFWWLGRSVDWWPFANSQRETCLPPLYRSNGILGCPSRKGLCKVRNNYVFFIFLQCLVFIAPLDSVYFLFTSTLQIQWNLGCPFRKGLCKLRNYYVFLVFLQCLVFITPFSSVHFQFQFWVS